LARIAAHVVSALPMLRRMGRLLRYGF